MEYVIHPVPDILQMRRIFLKKCPSGVTQLKPFALKSAKEHHLLPPCFKANVISWIFEVEAEGVHNYCGGHASSSTEDNKRQNTRCPLAIISLLPLAGVQGIIHANNHCTRQKIQRNRPFPEVPHS